MKMKINKTQFEDIHSVADSKLAILTAAIIAGLTRLRSRATVLDIERALRSRNVNDVLRVLGLFTNGQLTVDFGRALNILEDIFEGSGRISMRGLPAGIQDEATFTLTNPRVLSILRTYKFQLIVGLRQKTEEAIRRRFIEGLSLGTPPRQLAKNLRAIIGLTEKQSAWVNNFRRQLEQQSNLNFQHVDRRRLDARTRRQVSRHLRFGTMSQSQIDEVVGRYANSLLSKRALDIGRTESIRASTLGQQALWEEAADEGLLVRQNVRQFWIFTDDDRVRDTHRAITSMNPGGVELGGLFFTPLGFPVTGPPAETNCRCTLAIQEIPNVAQNS